jgi:hypothetical protein
MNGIMPSSKNTPEDVLPTVAKAGHQKRQRSAAHPHGDAAGAATANTAEGEGYLGAVPPTSQPVPEQAIEGTQAKSLSSPSVASQAFSSREDLPAGIAQIDDIPTGPERLKRHWALIVACDAERKQYGRLGNQALYQQLSQVYLAGRTQADAVEVEERLRALGQVLERSNKPFYPRVVAAFDFRVAGDNKVASEKSSANKYAAALDGIEKIVAGWEKVEGKPIGDGSEAVRRVIRLIEERTITGLEKLGRQTGDKDDALARGVVALDVNAVLELRIIQGKAALEAKIQTTIAGTGEKNLGGLVLAECGADGVLRVIEPAGLDTPEGRRSLAKDARPEEIVDLLGDTFLLGTSCVEEAKGARHHLIVRPDATMIYSLAKADAGVVVEVQPRADLGAVLRHGVTAPTASLWVRPNDRPKLEVNIADRDRRVPFSFACHPPSPSHKTGLGVWMLRTRCARGADLVELPASLQPAAFWGSRKADAPPLDVKRDVLLSACPAFSSAVRPEWMRRHAETWGADIVVVPGQAKRAVKEAKLQRVPEEALARAVLLAFDDRRVKITDGVINPSLQHDPGDAPMTMCPEVGVVLRDWVSAVQTLAKLALTTEVRLDVWPEGMMRLVAATEQGSFTVWVPLTTRHGKTRSTAMFQLMSFEAAQGEGDPADVA